MMPESLESSVNTIHQTSDDNSSSCSASSRTDTASSIDTASYAETLSSILDLPSAATFIDEDPHATAAAKQIRRSFLQNFYRGLEYQEGIGQGAVFKVGLYINKSDKREYAVKHAIRSQTHHAIGNRRTGGIFRALQEIKVISHDALAHHENIVHIFGWDMTIHRDAVIIAEYACNRTLRDFLLAGKKLVNPACNWNLKRNFALDVAAGLSAIHAADIAHGDIKLDNTLVFPHPKRHWYAKLSDFSHSVLGISTKRITAYPGSGIYNAPGVRNREDYITSDLLPSCETFSYGLLVWELLKDGESFLESDWLGHSTIPSAPDGSHKISKEAKIMWLEQLPHDNLLDRAMAFLGTLRTMKSYMSSSFALVFEHSLKDRSGLRSAMSTITAMLDCEDRATILYRSTTLSIKPIAIWDFVPWATRHPWKFQVDIMQGYLEEVQESIQPNHAEWYLLLARCHAEGFGTAINYSEMIECLKKSSAHGSAEASFMLLFIELHFPDSTLKSAPLRKPITVKGVPIFESPMEVAMQTIRKQGSFLPPRIQYIGMIQLWNRENSSYVRDQPFNLHGTTFFWKKNSDMVRFLDEVRAGPLSIWDITIEFESLDSSLQSAGFFETCAAFGINAWWIMAMDFAQYEQNISREQKEGVFYNCLIAALQNGQNFFIDAMEAQTDQSFLQGLAKTVVEERSKSPFHFLPLYSTDDAKLQGVASKLLDIGFGDTINQDVTKKLWLQPLGIGLYGTPLHMAVKVRSLPAVKALMTAGATPFETSGTIEGSPLELAICLNLHEIVQFMLNGKAISDGVVKSSARALGKLSNKGVFDNWILHSRRSPAIDPLSSSIQRTIRELSRQFGGLDLSRDTMLLQYLETGCKNAEKLKLLWTRLEKKDGYHNLSTQTIEKGLVLAEQAVGDDPLNRDLLQFFFTTIIPLSNSKSIETRPDALLLRWVKTGAIYNINDFSLRFKSEEWGHFIRVVNGKTSALVDAAISSGCLRTFDFVMQHISVEECLTRAIDCRVKECVTHVVKSMRGTIYCKMPTTTALHHAAATSNRAMVQHLLSIRISRTTQHIQHLHPTSRSEAGSQTAEFRVFGWDPIFNMQDRANSNNTALDIAADTDDTMTIEALLGNEEVNDAAERGSQTMLGLAVKNGQVNLVKRLLMRQCSPYCVLQESNLTSSRQREAPPAWNLIFQSIYYTFRGDIALSTLERLLALCKDEDIKSIEKMNPFSFWKTDRLWNGWLPIHYAIFCGRIGIVRAVLAAEIWFPNEKTAQHPYYTGQGFTAQMFAWSNAFYYGQLLERDYIEEKNVLDPQPKTKNLIAKITTTRHKAKDISPSPSSEIVEVVRLDTDSLGNSQYRYCHLWARGQEFKMDLGQVHNLIWANKTCRQLALDLIEWHDFVQLPYERSQQRTVSKASRTEIVFDLDKWTREKIQRAKRNAELSLDDHGPPLSGLEKSVARMIKEISEDGTASSEPAKLPSVTATTIPRKRTPEPEEISWLESPYLRNP